MRHATRRMTLAAAFALVSAALIGQALADDAKVEGDLKKMQGAWENTAAEGPESTWTFEGDKLTTTIDGGEYKSVVKLDEKGNPHPTADITIKEAPGDAAGATVKAIYKFEGDRLLFCVAFPGRENRPTEFKSTPEESHFFELKKK